MRKGSIPLQRCRGEGGIRNDEGKKRRKSNDSIGGHIGIVITHDEEVITR